MPAPIHIETRHRLSGFGADMPNFLTREGVPVKTIAAIQASRARDALDAANAAKLDAPPVISYLPYIGLGVAALAIGLYAKFG
jgi:hypothetical protein